MSGTCFFENHRPLFRRKSICLNELDAEYAMLLDSLKGATGETLYKKCYQIASQQLFDVFDEYSTPSHAVFVPKTPSSAFLPMLCLNLESEKYENSIKSFSYTDVLETTICNIYAAPMGIKEKLSAWIVQQLLHSHSQDYIFAIFKKHASNAYGVKDFIEQKVSERIVSQVSCFIGIEKQGKCEVSTYGHESKDFLEVLGALENYKQVVSTYASDISLLADEYALGCANVSIGYYNRGTSSECFVLSEVMHALQTLQQSLPKLLGQQRFPTDEPSLKRRIMMRQLDICAQEEAPFHKSTYIRSSLGINPAVCCLNDVEPLPHQEALLKLIEHIAGLEKTMYPFSERLKDIHTINFFCQFGQLKVEQEDKVASIAQKYNYHGMLLETQPRESYRFSDISSIQNFS